MSSGDLAGPLLRSVSRSFYLSIRLLPGRLRMPIGLAYLLARASDTIADSADTPPAERRSHLATLSTLIQEGTGNKGGLDEIQAAIRSPDTSENALIARLQECLTALAALDAVDRALIRAVLARIIHGQDLDLVRFADTGKLAALQTAAELEEYTYLVAGCVGEFWTNVCLHHYSKLSRLEDEPLRKLGVEFGKALQFVNILRDLPADLRQNRSYLPSDEIEPGVLLTNPEQARPVFDRWHLRAEELLESGRRYTASLRIARLRAACFLPWEIGRRTLELMAIQPPLETAHRIKVTRGSIRATLLRAAIVAFSNRPLN